MNIVESLLTRAAAVNAPHLGKKKSRPIRHVVLIVVFPVLSYRAAFAVHLLFRPGDEVTMLQKQQNAKCVNSTSVLK